MKLGVIDIDITEEFKTFETRVEKVIGFKDNVAIDVLFDIVERDTPNPYVYDFPEFRSSSELCLAAVLLAQKGKRVVYLSPTTYYGAKASQVIRILLNKNNSIGN